MGFRSCGIPLGLPIRPCHRSAQIRQLNRFRTSCRPDSGTDSGSSPARQGLKKLAEDFLKTPVSLPTQGQATRLMAEILVVLGTIVTFWAHRS